MDISKLLKTARESRTISQSALGRVVGISNQTLSDIERGKRNLPPKYVPAIAEHLGVAESELRSAMSQYRKGGEQGNAETI